MTTQEQSELLMNMFEALEVIKKVYSKPNAIYDVACPVCAKLAKVWKSTNNRMIVNCKSCGFSFTE